MAQQPITLIGGGLVGALLAQQLARRGFAVEVFEKRSDPRRVGFIGGRSINLALAERGLQALRTAGLADDVLQRAVMMRGRMVHAPGGRSGLQRYGVDDSEVIWSVSRGALNMLLLDAAEAAGVRFHFGQSLTGADFGRQRIRLADEAGVQRERDAGLLLGADGAGSALRAAMNAHAPLGERIESLGHGYKELEIPPADELPPAALQLGGGREQFALEPHALHIWPRGGYMCIALPNAEGSFTVTLFLPAQGAAPSFAALPDAAAARAFFAADFPDLLPLIPRFDEDFDGHPVGTLSTLYLDRWHLDGRALLVGDAAHAIVPFHGQGMNCGFEDDAIAAMALENYVEMRDSVADPHYLAKRELGSALAARIPDHYMARYRLVTFTHVPYAYALERGRAQDRLLEQLLRDTPNAADVDLDAAARLFQEKLEPLPRLRHG